MSVRGHNFKLAFALAVACARLMPGADSARVSFPHQTRLGNIFTLGEQVRIEAQVESGDSVDWVVSDFRSRKVESGSSPVVGGRVTISPRATGKGYYLVRITARAARAVAGEGSTSYAVVAPAGAPDSRFGVVTHFSKRMSTDILPLVRLAGIADIRDENAWGHVEKTRGVFDFSARDRHLIKYMDALREAGLMPLEVMAFGNKLYFDAPDVPLWQAAPYDERGYEAYARYCTAVLKQYGDQIKALEIWNEYNGSFCAGPAAKDRPKYYTALLREAYKRIKTVRPDVDVVGGAMVNVPAPYFEKLLQNGALDYMDGVAVHPYKSVPEGVEKQVADFAGLMKQYNRGISKPIWVTETGTWLDRSIERSGSASYLVRMYTLLLTHPEVRHVYWYLLRDFEEFTVQGLVHGESDPMGKYTPVAVYPAYANLIQQLSRAEFVKREQSDPRTRIYRFQRANGTVFLAWSSAGATKLTFRTSSPLRVIDLVGGERQEAPSSGQVTVNVDDFPVYVVGSPAASIEVVEGRRPDRVLADSVEDFSREQGKANWTYYYYQSNNDGTAPYDPGNVQPMNWGPSPGDWAFRWAGPQQWFQLNEEAGSPGALQHGQGWAVRRWTSTHSGRVHITGQIRRKDKKGDGVNVRVFLDGREILSKALAPDSSSALDLDTAVSKGSKLDFAVTPGPALDASHDSTNFHITILAAQ